MERRFWCGLLVVDEKRNRVMGGLWDPWSDILQPFAGLRKWW